MGVSHPGASELAFLIARRSPFDTLSSQALHELLAETEVEFYRAGTKISNGHLVCVIHSGALDHDGLRLGPGDVLPPESPATAAEDSLCYRVPLAVAGPLVRRTTVATAEPPASPGRRTARLSLRTPWRDARWCAVDLELTGLDPTHDHIIAIGAVPIDHGRVILGRTLYTLVRSDRPSDVNALKAHNLRPEDLEHAPTLDEALELLLDALSGRHPVFHTAAIERSFLGAVFARRRSKLPAAADTQVLGRLWLQQRGEPPLAGLPLTRLARMLGQLTEEPHHALADALMTALAFIALAAHLDVAEQQTVGRLIRADERFRGARRFSPV